MRVDLKNDKHMDSKPSDILPDTGYCIETIEASIHKYIWSGVDGGSSGRIRVR